MIPATGIPSFPPVFGIWMSDGNQLPPAGETACPTYFAKRLIQQGKVGKAVSPPVSNATIMVGYPMTPCDRPCSLHPHLTGRRPAQLHRSSLHSQRQRFIVIAGHHVHRHAGT